MINDMKKKELFIMFASMVIGLQGCGSTKIEPAKDLVVVEQIDTVHGSREENNYCSVSFNVDVPINGPQALVDSVMTLVNREVYQMCEYCIWFDDRPDEYVAYSEKDMFTNDGERLLSHYLDKYKALIGDSLWNTFSLELKMEAQTEKFVTYGLEFFHCGGSCGSEKSFYTFDKRDGHQVRDIISNENLVRFFEDYPEYNTIGANPWSGYPGWKFSPEDGFDNSCEGLLDDCFTLVISGRGNHYILTDFPYSQIFSYLSPDAQALVGQENEGKLVLPPYQPDCSEDSQVWMGVDAVKNAILRI